MSPSDFYRAVEALRKTDKSKTYDVWIIDGKVKFMRKWPENYLHETDEGWTFEDETNCLVDERYETKEEALNALLDYAKSLN